jgi:hypothetical protein
MAAYSTDSDLVAIRPNILGLGVTAWTAKHDEAATLINRALESMWYKRAAEEHEVDWGDTPFDSSKVDKTQLVRLSCYKVLELAYLYLMKDSPEADGFAREREIFARMYNDELNAVLQTGISYDWDASGTVETDERCEPRYRRLQRA